MKTSEKTAALILIFAFFLGLLCTGCVSPHRPESNRVSSQFQTKVPDIWDDKPKQEISIKMEFRR